MPKNFEKKVKLLTAKQEFLLKKTHRLLSLTKRFPDNDAIDEFKILFRSLKDIKCEFEKVFDEINYLKLENDANSDINFDLLEDFQKLACEIEMNFEKVNMNASVVSGEHVRLPKLELPSFDGDLKKWAIFKETFSKVVHENSSLTADQKVQYLMGRLSGRALQTISSLPATAANYDTIWTRLCDKYQDETKIARFYFNQMFQYRPITQESGCALEHFLENFVIAFEGLKNVQLPNLSDFIILQLALTKLDSETVKNFEMYVRNEKIPTFEQLRKFLEQQCKILSESKKFGFSKVSKVKIETKSQALLINKFPPRNLDKKCKFCNEGEHQLYQCNNFLSSTPKERFDFVKRNKRCYNCLSDFHILEKCKSKTCCNNCKRKHHSLLHLSNVTSEVSSDPKLVGASFSLASREAPQIKSEHNTVLLATALIKLNVTSNQTIRVILDSASQSSLITKKCCQYLGLQLAENSSCLLGIGNAAQRVLGKTRFEFSSCFNDQVFDVEALIVDKICGKLPSVKIDNLVKTFLGNVLLADPNFDSPGEVDALLGADIFPALVKENKFKIPGTNCFVLDTLLGFVVMGTAPAEANGDSGVSRIFVTWEEPIESLLKNFWEMENFHIDDKLTESECEKLFLKGVFRNNDGRYMVELPFRESPEELGESKSLALKRFLNLEKKFNVNPDLKLAYDKVIKEYINKDYLREVNNIENLDKGYFVPHHGVLKKDSSTTPLRMVFDASAKTSSGKSLNDLLHIGPKLHANPLDILINFRIFKIALGADIRQMYLQILLNEKHTKFQRMFWRFDVNEPLKVFELQRIAFGLRSSPFLALRVIDQLIKDESKNYPLACEFVPRDMYVDDIICSVESSERARELYKQLTSLFKSGGFELGKWFTNKSEILKNCANDYSRKDTLNFNFSVMTKVLGLRWDPVHDSFFFDFELPSELSTKRNILSTVAKMFDPLGLIGPILLIAKLLIKQLWKEKLDWDDKAPDEIEKIWKKFLNELKLVSEIRIPRHIFVFDKTSVDLIGFCDGSEKAYGAVVYVRTVQADAQINSVLLCSKSKVTPMKNITLPRIELCGAVLLSEILKFVLMSFRNRIVVNKIIALSDSQIVLSWLNSAPDRWQTFVANRVAKIQQNLPSAWWYHVSSKDNPADIVSRGVLPSKLKDNEFWWQGPSWLRVNYSQWPISREHLSQICEDEKESSETSQSLLTVQNGNSILDLANRISSWSRLLRIVSYVLKFLRRLSFLKTNITAMDLDLAERYMIKTVQNAHWEAEIKCIKKGKICNVPFMKLHPFLHEDLLRVGGRLANSELSFNEKHPILIPKESPVANLIIDFYHKTFLHPGTNLLISLIRQKFWIVNVRRLVKNYIAKCIKCYRIQPKLLAPMMADLPKARVMNSRAFAHTGIDYAGPFYITLKRGRGQKKYKSYIALFVCMATKAVHVEVCSDLNTLTFLNAFKRFISRRGPCEVLYSDRGTNFQGAKNLLKELYSFLNNPEYVKLFGDFLAERRIVWRFNPPAAPHFGGLWESLVKSFKRHLHKTIGLQILCLEEFETLCAQIEALMNSRPLSTLSEDPSELLPLTPSHFLVAKPLDVFPNTDVTPLSALGRPKLLEQLVEGFWKRWSREYLHELQVRQKWSTPGNPVSKGTVVILMENNLPPLHWPLGVIDEVFPAKDGHIRVAKVRTAKGIYVRPVVKLSPLPINKE